MNRSGRYGGSIPSDQTDGNGWKSHMGELTFYSDITLFTLDQTGSFLVRVRMDIRHHVSYHPAQSCPFEDPAGRLVDLGWGVDLLV